MKVKETPSTRCYLDYKEKIIGCDVRHYWWLFLVYMENSAQISLDADIACYVRTLTHRERILFAKSQKKFHMGQKIIRYDFQDRE